MNFTVNYGKREFACEFPASQLKWQQTGPAAVEKWQQTMDQALNQPLDYPLLSQAVVPGDRVAIVVDPDTPAWPQIANALGAQLLQAGLDAESIHIVLNEPLPEAILERLVSELKFPVIDHQSAMASQKTYLASTAEGQRVYLPAVIADRDYVLTLSRIGFDEQWGYRGTHSTIYPAFAPADEQERWQGQSQQGLTPEDSRGTRQTIDEVGWLLGVHFSVQVIPSASGEVAAVLCGAADSVFQRGVELLNQHWRAVISPEQRAETVLVAMPGDEMNRPWQALARACKAAGELAVTDGRVILLTDLQQFPESLSELLVNCSGSDDVLRKLSRLKTPEANALHALVHLTQQAKVYLQSGLEQDLVENLYCIPLGEEAEIRRALAGGESFALLAGAQYAYIERAKAKS